MPLMSLANLVAEHTVSPNQDIPKDEMDVFFRSESSFLPEGKTWDELTEEEIAAIKSRYRFDPMRPGTYQGITGLGKMIN